MNATAEILLNNNVGNFTGIDYTVFIVMLCISTAIGIYFGCFGQNEQSTEEYLLGGRQMKTLPIAISLIASQLSGISIMTIPAEVYTFGLQYWIVVPSMFVITLMINYVFLPVFYNNHISNCYEYLETRFSAIVRKIVTGTFVFNVFLLLPVIIFIPALAFSQVTGVNIHLINAIVCSICIFYTMLGGIKAVVWTDVVQAGIMLFSCILIMAIGIMKIGGLSEVLARASAGDRLDIFNMKFDLTTRQTFWNASIGNIVLWGSYIGLNQSCVQRLVSVPTLGHARSAITIFTVGFFLIMSLNCFTGIVMFARYFECDPIKLKLVEKADKMLPFFVQDVVGYLRGMPGVFISCVFSAGLSTMSANLNSLSGIIYADYVRPRNWFKHTDRNANLTMKIIICATGTYCVLMGYIVEQFSYIFQTVMSFGGIAQGVSFGVFSLGMLCPWATKKGALWGIIAGVVCMVYVVSASQIAVFNGTLKYKPLPTNVTDCSILGFNVTDFPLPIAPTVAAEPDDSFAFYKVSFLWFGVSGSAIVWIVGIAVSFMTGANDLRSVQPVLISPIAHFLLPKEVFHKPIPMQTHEEPENDAEQKSTVMGTEWVFNPNETEEKKEAIPEKENNRNE